MAVADSGLVSGPLTLALSHENEGEGKKNQLLGCMSSRHVVVAGGGDPGRSRRCRVRYELLQYVTRVNFLVHVGPEAVKRL